MPRKIPRDHAKKTQRPMVEEKKKDFYGVTQQK
jgi:hypothetical protein